MTLRVDAPEWQLPRALRVDAPEWQPSRPEANVSDWSSQKLRSTAPSYEPVANTRTWMGTGGECETQRDEDSELALMWSGNGEYDATYAYQEADVWSGSCSYPSTGHSTDECQAYCRQDESGGQFDYAGNWIPPACTQPQSPSLDRPSDDGFKTRANAIVAKAKFAKAIQSVAPAKDVIDEVPDSMCWDLVKTGHCRRGNACKWRHSVDETEEAAFERGVLAAAAVAAQQAPLQGGYNRNQYYSNARELDFGDLGARRDSFTKSTKKTARPSNDEEREAATSLRVHDVAENTEEEGFATPAKQRSAGHGRFDLRSDEDSVQGGAQDSDKDGQLSACKIGAKDKTPQSPPSWADVVKAPPGFKALRVERPASSALQKRK